MGQGDPAAASDLQDSLAGWDAQQANHQPHFQLTMQGVPPRRWQELRIKPCCEVLTAEAFSKVHFGDHGSS